MFPREKWQKKLMDYKALEIKYQNGKEIFIPVHRTYLISNDDFEIVRNTMLKSEDSITITK